MLFWYQFFNGFTGRSSSVNAESMGVNLINWTVFCYFLLYISFSDLICFHPGQVHIDEMYLMFFNVLFTGVPPLISGILDQDLTPTTLYSHSYVYKLGQTDAFYRVRDNCSFRSTTVGPSSKYISGGLVGDVFPTVMRSLRLSFSQRLS